MVQHQDEPIASHLSRLPRGYVFVPKGNVFITGKVRKLTNEAGKTLWRVQDGKGQEIGLRCPSEVYELVLDLEAATRADREENITKKDLRDIAKARAAVRRLFPRIPSEDIDKLVKRAFEKASGRVGRTTLISLDDRVAMAVWAHIRHEHTSYDSMLGKRQQGGLSAIDKDEIRREIRPLNELTFCAWGGTQELMRSSGIAYVNSKVSKKRVRRRSVTRATLVKTRNVTTAKHKVKKPAIVRQTKSSPRTKKKDFLSKSQTLSIRRKA